ncbi:hypothetical protein DL93DRAFT_976215 [Clavulina sp. PMI_390]|nr:hypothetical protein DL93DRAFT_976215 [Clavulina sp. PMI_390]
MNLEPAPGGRVFTVVYIGSPKLGSFSFVAPTSVPQLSLMGNFSSSLSRTVDDHKWPSKLSLDVIFLIASCLDPSSLAQLSCTCKLFHTIITSEALVWRRALRTVALDHCIAPHSFTYASISEMRRLSIRPSRLKDAFLDRGRQLHVSVRKYVLDYETSMPPRVAGSFDSIRRLHPKLLPGGRWILTGIVIESIESIYLFCWDRHQSRPDTKSLHPVSTFSWEGLGIITVQGEWAQAQSECSTSVLLACSLTRASPQGRFYDVLRLSWKETGDSVVIEFAARLELNAQYINDLSIRNHMVQGEYLLIHDKRSLLLWNWKDDTFGKFDEDHCEWADGKGFLVTFLPPYLFIIPQEESKILVVEIPPLHPVSSSGSRKIIRPTRIFSHPFLSDNPGLFHMNLYAFDLWKPPSMHCGTVMIRSIGMDHLPCFTLLSLRPPDVIPPVPSTPITIMNLPFGIFTNPAPAITVIDGIGIIFLARRGRIDDQNERIVASVHRFAEAGDPDSATEREFRVPYPVRAYPSPVDLVSGTSILKSEAARSQIHNHIVGVLCFF